MKRNITIQILTIMLFCLLLGCEANNKYTYILIVNKEVRPGDSVRKFMAGEFIFWPTDSAAYQNAFVKFFTSRRVYDSIYSSGAKLPLQPTGFMLLNENGIDISKSVNFANKDSMESKIEKVIRELTFP